MARYVAEVTAITPLLAGFYKKAHDFRLFTKIGLGTYLVLYKSNSKKSRESIETLHREGYLSRDTTNTILKLLTDENIPIPEETYEKIKELLLKEGFSDLDFIFPRNLNNLEIDYHKLLSRPLYTVLKYRGDWLVTQILEIRPVNVQLGTYVMYTSNTKSPIFFETIEPGSKFIIVFEAENQGKNEFEGFILRLKKYGNGHISIKVYPLNTNESNNTSRINTKPKTHHKQ